MKSNDAGDEAILFGLGAGENIRRRAEADLLRQLLRAGETENDVAAGIPGPKSFADLSECILQRRGRIYGEVARDGWGRPGR
jgi:hypothetical protein